MELQINNKDNGIRAHISGRFTFEDNRKFRQITEALDTGQPHFVEIDLADAIFIDSAGIGMLLLLRDHCQNKHIPVSIHSAQGQIKKILTVSKFDQLFAMHN